MHELAQSSEDVKIPIEWEFRGKDRCSVVQIDTAQRFLSVVLPSLRGLGREFEEGGIYKGEYADYFFGRDGRPANYLHHSAFETIGKIKGDALSVSFRAHEYQYPESVEIDIDFQPLLPVETLGDTLGDVSYKLDHLQHDSPFAFLRSVYFGRAYHPLDTELTSPTAIVLRDSESKELSAEGWRLNQVDVRKDFKRIDSNKTFAAYEKDGELKYTLQWDVVDGLLQVKMTQLDTGTVKTLCAPLQVDTRSVRPTIFQRGPFSQDKHGFYKVPWMEILNVVGSRLTYEQPTQVR